MCLSCTGSWLLGLNSVLGVAPKPPHAWGLPGPGTAGTTENAPWLRAHNRKEGVQLWASLLEVPTLTKWGRVKEEILWTAADTLFTHKTISPPTKILSSSTKKKIKNMFLVQFMCTLSRTLMLLSLKSSWMRHLHEQQGCLSDLPLDTPPSWGQNCAAKGIGWASLTCNTG